MRNLLLALLPRGQNFHVDPGLSKVRHRSVPTDHCDGGPPGTPRHALAPEKYLGDQAAEKFIREKIERLRDGRVNA
ncbi:MAG TPA: hypothetical protein VHX99_04250 [Rhizomicrobium sp.]|jgi:hypothetical protein|nr:hypothetical protein [Rhizomicrobium sp.]